jgi:hypothetical protein
VRETRVGDGRYQRVGIHLGPDVSRVEMNANVVQGQPDYDLPNESNVPDPAAA